MTDEAIGIANRFDYYDDSVDQQESERLIFERSAARTTDAAIRWLDERRDPEKPHLLWVHYIDPRGPYNPPKDKPTDYTHEGTHPIDPTRIHDYQRDSAATDGLEYIDRYDEEIAYTDREVGRLLAHYTKLGLTSNSVVLFTADHGETLMEHDRLFTHGYHVWEPIMRVPLLIRYPGSTPIVVDEPVSLVDLVPTVLSLVNVPAPVGLDGINFTAARDANRRIYLEAFEYPRSHIRAVVIGPNKWVVVENGGKETKCFRTNLVQHDPEKEEEACGEGAPVEELRASLSRETGDYSQVQQGKPLSGPKQQAPRLLPEQIRNLKSLGYLN